MLCHKPVTLSWCKPGVIRDYVTTKELSWPVGKKGSPLIVTIPKGTEFESSVLWFVRWILSPHDPRFLESACVHDWLLENGYDADFSDSQWLAAARKNNAPKSKAHIIRLLMLVRRYWQNRRSSE